MKIYLATDHAGFSLKEKIKNYLHHKKYTVIDCGAFVVDGNDDYPDFIEKAAGVVSKDPTARGIILGGSGQGEAMVANKFPNVRAAVFYGSVSAVGEADIQGRKSDDPFEMITLTRLHNDANILSLGARFLTEESAIHAVQLFLDTAFSNEERHKRRIEKIGIIEEKLDD